MVASIRRFASAAIIVGVAVIVSSVATMTNNFDFRAFYCAGTAVREHANPYHTEPLHTCEWKSTDSHLAAFARKIIDPAPLPGYDMAVFALLSYLPFALAAKLWTAILLLCSIASIFAICRFSNVQIDIVTVAMWLSLVVPSIFFGELIPLCVVAVAVAALCAKSGRWALAGVCATASLVEPHIGLPVCAAMFLWAPRTRPAILASVLALATVSFITLGFQWNREYLALVLPAQALSEIASDGQLSASVALHWLRVPDGVALRLGMLSYFAMAAFAVYLSRVLANRFSDESLLVTIPAAFAVMGGAYIHVTESTLAVLLVLSLTEHLRLSHALAAAGVVLLAVPWWSLATPILSLNTAPAMVFVTITYLVWRLSNQNALTAVGIGAFAALTAVGLVYWHSLLSVPFTSINPPPDVFSATYPEANWAWISARFMSTGSPPTWLLRALTWAGLLCAASQTVICAVRSLEARVRHMTPPHAAGGLPE